MLYQLVYSSVATEAMPKSKLYKILHGARAANAIANVTGLLVFAEGKFLQVLEGQKEVVCALMQKISMDHRHNNVRVVTEQAIDTRIFPSWKMAYVSTNASELAAWAGLRSTTTIEETLARLTTDPARVPNILQHLLGAIREP
jgi:hypothetical protein